MKPYPVLLMAVVLFVSLVVSETLRSNAAFSYLSQDNVNQGIRQRRSAAPPAAAQPVLENINYRPYSQVPANIKQLLQFQQAREPITHIAPQPVPQFAKAPSPARAQYNPQPQPNPQAAYQPQQSVQYQQNSQQIQPAYNPQQQQQFHGNQQQAPGNVFRPEQRRLY